MVIYITGLVARLVRKYGTSNPYELCGAMGIEISDKNLGKALAYYICTSRIRMIVLNEKIPWIWRALLLAHELGHDRLHKAIAGMQRFQLANPLGLLAPTEKEANYFAAELLIRDKELLDLLYYDGRTFDGIAGELYVPGPLLPFKLDILKCKGYDIQAQYEVNGSFLKNLTLNFFEDDYI